MTLTDIAKELGVSRPTLNKYRGEGCPIDAIEAARAWVAARKASDGRGGNRGQTRGKPTGGGFLDLKESLMRATLAKTEAEARLKGYEAEIAQKNLVSMDTARAYVAEVLAPLRTLLDALPQSCGPRANPADPTLGEQAIRESLDQIFKVMDKNREGGGENVG